MLHLLVIVFFSRASGGLDLLDQLTHLFMSIAVDTAVLVGSHTLLLS